MNPSWALQDRFLARFFTGPLAETFYLTGGPALARFYFQHRESEDLDLFTNDQDQDFTLVLQTVTAILHALDLQTVSQAATDTFIRYIVRDPAGTLLKVDLVKDVPVRFGDPITHQTGVRIDSLQNIGANKVLAVFGRTDAKDFIDLYWILQNTALTFDALFAKACEKDAGLSELYLAYALQNCAKIRLFPRMLKPLAWDEIQTYFVTLARVLITRIKPG